MERNKKANKRGGKKMKGLGKGLIIVFLVFLILSFHKQVYGMGGWVSGHTITSNETSYENDTTVSCTETKGDNESAMARGVYAEPSANSLTSFENKETGKISGTAQSGNAFDPTIFIMETYGYGVYIEDRKVDTFINKGDISGFAESGNLQTPNKDDFLLNAVDAHGVYMEDDVGTFTNTSADTISGYANSKDALAKGEDSYAGNGTLAYGVHALANVGTFTNDGSITADSISGSATAEGKGAEADNGNEADGVEIDGDVNNFINQGNISSSSTQGDSTTKGQDSIVTSESFALGVNIGGNVGTFTNASTETISAISESGNVSVEGEFSQATGRAYSYGVDIGGDVTTFSQKGTILSKATSGDVKVNSKGLGYGGAYSTGVDIGGSVGTFTNTSTETISAVSKSGDVSAEADDVQADHRSYAFGVDITGDIDTFTNTGTISASATLGDVSAEGNNSKAEGYAQACGVRNLDGDVNNLTNKGSISVTARVGSASGAGARAVIDPAAGIYLKGNNKTGVVNNEGKIEVTARAGSGAEVLNVAGIYTDSLASATINNQGNIYININAPDAKEVDKVAGILIKNTQDALVLNPGLIHLWARTSATDIRTLRVENSTVTLSSKFSVIFGQYGIDKRPIYIDQNSTLNLNNATLVAHIGDFLRFNTPYYLIENDGGTVNGVFGGLQRGYTNQNIVLSWYGADRGENAAVIFKYRPRKFTSTSSIHATILVSKSILEVIMNKGINWAGFRLLGADTGQLLYADSGQVMVDAQIRAEKGEKWTVFLEPFYTDINADKLEYDASAGGFVMGLEKRGLGSGDLTFGLFGSYGRVDVDFDKIGADNDLQDIYSFGFYLDWLPSSYYLGLIMMGYIADHDYSGRTGLNYEIHERADYWSRGLEARLITGYIFHGKSYSIMPHIGLDLIHWEMNNFHTEATDQRWNKHFEGESDESVSVIAGLSGIKGWTKGDRMVYLSVLAQVEEALGDNDISIVEFLPYFGSPRTKVKEHISNFSLIGRIEFGLRVKGGYNIAVRLDGNLNADYTAYTTQLVLRKYF